MPMLAPPPVEAPAAPTLSALRWTKRVVVAFADRAGDPLLQRQRRIVAELMREADDRDLAFVTVAGDWVEGAGDTAAALRAQLQARGGFHVVLVGKDGRPKLNRSAPLSADELTRTIDAMPMRRAEVRR